MSQLHKTPIVTHQQITSNVFIVSIKKSFDFKAGQIIGISLDKNIPPRLYSICSSPGEEHASILFNIKEDGKLTPPLAKAMVGDSLYFTQPQGKFLYQSKNAWWIATGTGIAPFRSMFRNNEKPLRLIQGGRKAKDLYFRDEFESLPDYIKCCSQDYGTGLYEGRLTNYLNELDHFPTNINYYLCGSAEMVVDVRNLLIAKGVNFNNIITEIYF